tara:strand:- start:2435 stop:2635 length:201 start_codon:yes stop_codon:yes gene_type:complete
LYLAEIASKRGFYLKKERTKMDKSAIIQQINKIIEDVARMKKLIETLQARLKHTETKTVYYRRTDK